MQDAGKMLLGKVETGCNRAFTGRKLKHDIVIAMLANGHFVHDETDDSLCSRMQ